MPFHRTISILKSTPVRQWPKRGWRVFFPQAVSWRRRSEERLFDWFWFRKNLSFTKTTKWSGEGFLGYMPTRLWVLRKMFKSVNLKDFDLIVDAGCGAGRFIRFALLKNSHAQICGVEIDGELAELARKAFLKNRRVHIIQGDMCISLPSAPGKKVLVFAFNPLDFKGMKLLKQAVEVKYLDCPKLIIAYVNPLQLHIFRSDPTWKIDACPRPEEDVHNAVSEYLYAFISRVGK